MGKGATLPSQIQERLELIYINSKEEAGGKKSIGATEARERLRAWMEQEGLDKNFDSPDYPSRSTVHVHLKKIKDNDKKRPLESKNLDEPWSIGISMKYGISPEALPLLLEIQKNIVEEIENSLSQKTPRTPFGPRKPLTIRDARWIAYLRMLTQDTNDLYLIASIYATNEQLSEISSYPRSTAFDIDPFIPDLPIEAAMRFMGRSWLRRDRDFSIPISPEQVQRLYGIDLSESGLTPVGILAFVRWRFIMGQLPRWSDLNEDQENGMMLRLCDWVRKTNDEDLGDEVPIELIRELDNEIANIFETTETSLEQIELFRSMKQKWQDKIRDMQTEIAILKRENAIWEIIDKHYAEPEKAREKFKELNVSHEELEQVLKDVQQNEGTHQAKE